ncbi:hypothetical protein WICPIJ_000884 [Wickerhamomyces pijperi]|uniref:Peptidyl-tRNA hydrolase n=1 Tax=Wickerhamomyces pijperi TaxID=599730 RepID=A0A9P8TQF2_WICPI|nr:hypothetical protein WICPIJ_000884 [Wickerhamomyces pijperi]
MSKSVTVKKILLVSGLGNPYPYLKTRHNMGQMLLDELVPQSDFTIHPKHTNVSLQVNRDYPNVIFMKNLNYMNISGNALIPCWKSYLNKYSNPSQYKIENLVIYDELEKEVGKYQLRYGKVSSRGHNGLRNIVNGFGNEFYRLGVGIGRPGNEKGKGNIADWVLSEVTDQDLEVIKWEVVPKIKEIIDELRK